jgi:hypothetical protein
MKKKIGIFFIVFGIAMFILILSGGGFPQAAIFNLFFFGWNWIFNDKIG